MKEALNIFLLIVGFAAILFAAYYFTKFIGSKMSYSNTTRLIKVLDRVFLGNDKSICIIQVGKRFFVIGITNHHVELISELDEVELAPTSTPISNSKESSFNNIFDTYLNRLKNKDRGQGMNKFSE
ncbi:MAG: flagellar biosynthetic protein FliO [Caldicoprobacterales bacterium]|nr:flagellar biosynthetic protein FliO [Clostridiales bacterium]